MNTGQGRVIINNRILPICRHVLIRRVFFFFSARLFLRCAAEALRRAIFSLRYAFYAYAGAAHTTPRLPMPLPPPYATLFDTPIFMPRRRCRRHGAYC